VEVTAKTFPDDDRELPPHEVRGELSRRYVPVLDYTQYLVAGEPVQPDTIRGADGEAVNLAEAADEDDEPSEVAVPGRDGDRAEQLLERARQEGVDVLSTITRQALERLLQSQEPGKAQALFDETERRILAHQLAATLAPAELLGRARIRLRAQQTQGTS